MARGLVTILNRVVGSLRNDDGYGNDKKQQYYWLKEEEMIVLHVRHAFLSFLSRTRQKNNVT